MNRRSFLKTAAVVPASAALSSFSLRSWSAPWTEGTTWRSFEVTTRVEVLKPAGATRVWLPMPLAMDTDYHRTLGHSWSGNATTGKVIQEPRYGTTLFYAEWADPASRPSVELTVRFATRDRAVGPAGTAAGVREDSTTLKRYLEPTQLLPTDGIVLETAQKITRGIRDDEGRARAIYDWIVDNTFRDPKTQGCGIGDIRAMLVTGNLGGKCADLNALFVGLARSVGVPARDVYGIRVADSAFGYKSLGKSGDITKAQHCRAEFYSRSRGWIPVDPADVRKVVLEEPPGNLALNDSKVQLAREKLFGAWEMNWLPYNYAHDLELPGSQGNPVAFLMYPQCETTAGRRDSLDPQNFRYQITSNQTSV